MFASELIKPAIKQICNRNMEKQIQETLGTTPFYKVGTEEENAKISHFRMSWDRLKIFYRW